MTAFWALFLLLAWGCLGGAGLVTVLRGWFPAWATPWTESQPLIGDVDMAKMVTLGVLAVGGFLLYRILNAPKVADLLIATEEEMKAVTWPSGGETWAGTAAVLVTVAILVVYLMLADTALVWIMPRMMGVGS